jgi:pilus assembly protein CpaE
MPASILLVDGNLTRQRALTYALVQEGYKVLPAPDAREALKLWKSAKPALAIADEDLPKDDGFALLERVRKAKKSDYLPFMLMVSDNAMRLQALRMGADEAVLRDTHPSELMVRVRGLLARHAPAILDAEKPRRRSGIIGVYAARGGAGATTIAINLGIVLHREFGRKVAIIDGNLQFGDHRIFFDLGRDTPGLVDLVGAPSLDLDTLNSVLVHHDSGVDLLLGPTSPAAAELVSYDDLPRVLEAMKEHYDYLVVDLGRQLDEYNLRIMDVADLLLIALTADLPSLKNTRLVLETAGSIGFPESRMHLVLNRSTSQTGLEIRHVEIPLGKPIDWHIVNDFKAGIAAVNGGAPVVLSKPGSPLAKALITFAAHIDQIPATRTRQALIPVKA